MGQLVAPICNGEAVWSYWSYYRYMSSRPELELSLILVSHAPQQWEQELFNEIKCNQGPKDKFVFI